MSFCGSVDLLQRFWIESKAVYLLDDLPRFIFAPLCSFCGQLRNRMTALLRGFDNLTVLGSLNAPFSAFDSLREGI